MTSLTLTTSTYLKMTHKLNYSDIGQVYRIAIGSEMRKRMEEMYGRPYFIRHAMFEHQFILTAAVPLTFLALTLLNLNGIHGGAVHAHNGVLVSELDLLL
ncbi:MAG: hypothetical protein ACP5UV_04295 [Thermoplasmata archaeon]